MKRFSKEKEPAIKSGGLFGAAARRAPFFARRFFLPAIFSAALLAALASCKSAPAAAVKVNPFDTLESDALVYMSVPAAAHEEFTASLIKSFMGNDVSDKYVKNVVDGLERVYVGIGSARDRKRLQVACDGTVSAASKLALSSSEYFDKKIQNVGEAGVYQVYTEKRSGIQISVPAGGVILLSGEITPQLQRYNDEALSQIASAALAEGGADGEKDSQWKEGEAYRFVGERTDNIRLFMNRPLSFITNLLGTSLSSSIFQLNYIEGDFKKLPSGKYSVDLNMEFSRDNLITKAVTFLKVALLMTDARVEAADGRHLSISGVQVSLSQMQRMLGVN